MYSTRKPKKFPESQSEKAAKSNNTGPVKNKEPVNPVKVVAPPIPNSTHEKANVVMNNLQLESPSKMEYLTYPSKPTGPALAIFLGAGASSLRRCEIIYSSDTHPK
jgi:hypothetical protein